MEDIHRKALIESITFLKDNLLAKDVLDHLVGENIITVDLKQRINFAHTDGDKVSELVCMLPKRGPRAFEAMLKSLRATSHEHVAVHLERKAVEIKEKQDAKTQNFVHRWLQDNINLANDAAGAAVNFEWLLDAVNNALNASNSDYLTESVTATDLKKMLMEAFQQPESAVNQSHLPFAVKGNLQIHQQMAVSESPKTSPGVKHLSKSMEDWSVADVCLWLDKIGMNVQQLFVRDNITGRALIYMPKEEFVEMGLTRGDRVIISTERDKYLKDPSCLSQELASEEMASASVKPELTSVENSDCVSLKSERGGIIPRQLLKLEVESHQFASLCSNDISSNAQHYCDPVAKKDMCNVEHKMDIVYHCDFHKNQEENTIPHKTVSENIPDSSASNAEANRLESFISDPPSGTAEVGLTSSSKSIEDSLITKCKGPSEILRPFGYQSGEDFKYKKDAKLFRFETQSGGNLLQPIHRFIMLALDSREGMKELGNEAIAFASACLNDRANATIHFGINPEHSSGFTIHGQITGLLLKKDLKQYEEFLNKAFAYGFSEQEVVKNCISDPIFIRVASEDSSIKSLEYVIEIDVIPKYEYSQDKEFFVKLKEDKDEKAIFRIFDGNVCRLKQPQIDFYKREIDILAKERKRQEEEAAKKNCIPRDHLCEKFINLLCDGDTKFQGDQYRILVLNKPDEAVDFESFKETFDFLADIEWKAIFDFDADAKVCKFLQERDYMMKIAMSDDFSPRSECNLRNIDHLKQIHEDIRNSLNSTWIFVNGYAPNDDQKLDPRKWKMEKSDGFKEAVRFFSRQIPQRRALVVFLLLSEDTSVVIEATEEFLTSFPNQWLCVSENESIGYPWLQELERRNCMDRGIERSVFGMPWKHVQEAIADIVTPRKMNCCEIPTSTEAFVVLPKKALNEFLDLEILSSFECDNSPITSNAHELHLHEVKEKEMFFRGNGVSWWNFWFQGQVCCRDILRQLKNNVKESLDDDDVGKVILRHQPGAGGTTTAKHLLWELRKEYRCGIVQSINEGQTAQQIINLYQYEDNSPTKPVLLLLDNPDEDKANLLVAELSEMAKSLTRKGGDQAKCVCIFLICLRRTEVGTPDMRRVVLQHQLSRAERKWFLDMNKQLLAEHKQAPDRFMDPKLLISFNILKENFNKEFIQRIVRSFLDSISDKKELRLLKYISLINSFDLECRSLPTSAFDGIMIDNPWANRTLRRGRRAYASRWETHLSSEFRVLVNEASKPSMGYIHALKIINPLLSKEILSCLRDAGSSRIPVSEIALEFYKCVDIFYASSRARDDLLEISKEILKKRGRLPNGRPETKFAPLIQTIVNEEIPEKASAVLEIGLQLTSDPFIAQQMARLFINFQNWPEAIKYATMAIEQKPDNSCLWDTFGRIYERQLLEQYDKLVAGTSLLMVENCAPIIDIALKGMEMFQKVQETNDREKTLTTNQAGFFGELRMVVRLLDCLTYFFPSKEELRHFILEAQYMPDNCLALKSINGNNYADKLKQLNRCVQTAVNRLEDELLQLREEAIDEFCRNHVKNQSDNLICVKENLNSYFGEDGDNVPECLEELEKCEFRRRRIFRLAGFNLRSIFDLRHKKDGMDVLKQIRDIAKQNIDSDKVNVDDYQTLISANLALASLDSEYRSNFSEYEDMLLWTKKLYELRDTSFVSHLEPYLFFVMFNWPRENMRQLVNPKVIENAIHHWKDAYYKKYPKQRGEGKPFRKKDTTIFFLGNGNNMESIYSQFEDTVVTRNGSPLENYWRLPSTMAKLQRLCGTLNQDGCEVKIQLQYGQGNKSSIWIPTSFPIRERRMWNKQVYFVIGFSWIGPKAFDITLDDPRTVLRTSRDGSPPRNFLGKEFHRTTKVVEVTEEQFCQELENFDTKLQKIKDIKKKKNQSLDLTHEENQLLQEEAKIQKEKDRLIQNRC